MDSYYLLHIFNYSQQEHNSI